MAATQSLFDIIYSSTAEPVKVEAQRIANQEGQLKLQEEALGFKNQQAFQTEMQQLWPGGESQAAQASSDPTADNSQRLERTAALLFKYGNPKEGTAVLSSLSLMKSRQFAAQNANQKVVAAQMKQLSTTAESVVTGNDQDAYSAAFPQIVELMTPAQRASMQLTGDLQQDLPKLQQLARSGTTYAQQTRLTQNAEKIKETAQQHAITNADRAVTLGQNQQKIDLSQKRLDALERYREWNKTEKAKADERAQQGLAMKGARQGGVNQYGVSAKVGTEERNLATATFAADDRTKGLPPNMMDVLKNQAIIQAKYDQRPDEGFDDALARTMDTMEKKGAFKSSGTSLMGNKQYEYKGHTQVGGKPVSKVATDPANYSTPNAVADAIKAGKITIEQGRKILTDKFGMGS